MTSTGTLIPWAVICGTYLRLRKAISENHYEGAVPEEAKSPLQPYLAGYGLLWCILLGISEVRK